jgi:cytochrome c oxidase subunit 2
VRRGSLLQLIGLTLIAFGIGAAVALLVPWLPHPASREAGRIWFVYWFATWICLAIFALVAAVLVFALLKFRAKPGDLSDGPPIHGHTMLEIVWTAVPFVLVTAIAIVSSIVLAKDGNAGSNPLRITVTTMQFAYRFTYPNGQTFEVMRVPNDRHVLLTLHSDDVIHSFWVPNWGQKSDAVPGLSNKLVVTPDEVGTFPIICTQLCGLGHALMRSEAIVMSDTSYDSWYKSTTASTSTSSSAGTSASVATLFKTTATCGACHTLAAAGSKGTLGPNLDDLSAAAAKAGMPLEAYVKQSIEDPDAYITPGYKAGVMSASCCKQLSSSEVTELVQYLVKNTK